jgi:hypothetical protein
MCRMKGFTQVLFFGILSNTLYDDEGFSFDRGISKVHVTLSRVNVKCG